MSTLFYSHNCTSNLIEPLEIYEQNAQMNAHCQLYLVIQVRLPEQKVVIDLP